MKSAPYAARHNLFATACEAVFSQDVHGHQLLIGEHVFPRLQLKSSG